MSDIFISYASADQERIIPLVQAFEDAGWSVFWDRNIPAGATWREVIGSEVERCCCMVVVWSIDSIKSHWVQEEAEAGKSRDILIPVLLDSVFPPIGFRSIQAANLVGWKSEKPDHSINTLLHDISKLIGKPSTHVAPEQQFRHTATQQSGTLIEKWKTLSQDNRIKIAIVVVSAVLAVVGYSGKSLIESLGDPSATMNHIATQRAVIQHNSDGTGVVNTGSGTINIGISLEQHEAVLKHREAEVIEALKQEHSEDRQVLAIELQVIQQQLQDSKTSYEALVASLKERITQLESLRGRLPDDILEKAKSALEQGDRQLADQLFESIEDNAQDMIQVAEAVYQRCHMAMNSIRIADAYHHCQKAVSLAPDNIKYLNMGGMLAHMLGRYREYKDYNEQALASALKTYGKDHPEVATRWINLGGAWDSLGEYQKAIDYYEKALASNLKNFGENHPGTKIARSNLEFSRSKLNRPVKQ